MTGPFDRAAAVRRLERDSFDVLVVGGGITGTGAALDAASRGLRVALVERHDFASGTSSKSSKLVHGGLRYLQQGEIGLVYEALHERRRLMRNAPHLVRVLPFMIPVLTKHGVVSRKIARAFGSALWMYDLTGGWRIGRFHRRIGAEAAMGHLPTMPRQRVAAAYLYYDATADDARLCLTVARTAANRGAAVVNRAELTGVRRDASGRIEGAVVRTDGRELVVRTRCLLNAAGVWADGVETIGGTAQVTALRPAKGVHLTVPWDRVRNDIAVVVPVPKDKRSLFVVPTGARPDGTFTHTYVGTTDTDYDGPLDDPACTAADVEYVLGALNASLVEPLSPAEVSASWAGLRPLVAGSDTSGRTADLSRRHRVSVDRGVVTVTGGKLTTYREMAEDAVDRVVELLHGGGRLARWRRRSRTKRLTLLGGAGFTAPPPDSPQAHLAGRYGTLAAEIDAIAGERPDLAEPLVPGLPYRRAEAVYAVRSEQATTLDDVLARRTRARLFDRAATVRAAPDVAALLAVELGWDEAETARQVAAYVDHCAAEQAAVQPGAAEQAAVQPGAAEQAAMQPGAAEQAAVQPGAAER